MDYSRYILKANEIYDVLQDEESRKLFKYRINYMINRSKDEYYEEIDKLYSNDNWHALAELDHVLSLVKEKRELIIYGAGNVGKRAKRIVEHCGYRLDFFVDTDVKKVGEKILETEIISIEELVKSHTDAIVIIGSYLYKDEMKQTLIKNGFSEQHIIEFDEENTFIAVRGEQYFDVFQPDHNEVFVDVGAYNGDSVKGFYKWTDGKYEKIYALEPNESNRRELRKVFFHDMEVVGKAAWSKEEELYFIENGSSSFVHSKSGDVAIQAVDLDTLLRDEKITYIKMDIEGSEYKALEGAREVIQKNKPKLAICIYHKNTDILQIAAFILELVPDYKFYIRHYYSNMFETVLYARVEKD